MQDGSDPHEVDAFGSETIDVRRLKAAHLLDRRNPDLTDRRVVPHNVDDVGWRTVLLSKLGQLPAYVLIFGSPLGAVLRREDVVLSVMNNFWLCLLCNSSMAGSASHK